MIPKNLVLEGEGVRLEPLGFAHAPDLHEHGNDDEVWRASARSNPMTTLDRTREYIAEAVYGNKESPGGVPFAIVDRATGRAIGATRFFDISETERHLEIGWTWIGRAHWRTAVNTECKLLLLQYAFETAGMRRVQLKADSENSRSRNAIARIGATYEGTLRDSRVIEGAYRSTSYYSILADEWPAVKGGLSDALRPKTGSPHR